MFSFVERATTRTFVRVLVIALAAALLCGSLPVVLLAREIDKTPCELPGDADGVGGYKNFEFESAPSAGLNRTPGDPLEQHRKSNTVVVCARHAVLLIQFYLATRK